MEWSGMNEMEWKKDRIINVQAYEGVSGSGREWETVEQSDIYL